MKRIMAIIGYIIFIILMVVILSPKRYLYNFVEHKIVHKKIIISYEKVNDRLISLDISDGKVYFKDILMGKFKKIRVYPFIFVNYFEIKNFKISEDISAILSVSVDKISLFDWIGQPFKVFITAKGGFGIVHGFIDFKTKIIHLSISSSKKFIDKIKKLGGKFKKTKEGFYVYEYKY